tara:strand:- start:424 stop:1458 length:1035 start_codon:yes stop_codon:yes gene_type:complete
MVKLKNKFAIGCLVQWYEIELIGEYLQSVKNALDIIENKDNIIIDLYFNCSQKLEKIGDKISISCIKDKYSKLLIDIFDYDEEFISTVGCKYTINNFLNENTDNLYTIADYRRDFNNKYCELTDVLMWGETDSLIPKQTFEVLDLLHTNNISQNTYKYLAFFGTCKMWDDSWKPLEHVDFTDKPFIDVDTIDTKNWWSLRYNMNIDEMNEINDRVEELDVRVIRPFKFNGCGLVISSDVIKSGVNIPKSAFFIHEDTAFMFSLIKTLGEDIPQFLFKNILLVHNRKHFNKRMYVSGEENIKPGDNGLARKIHDWYKKASDMSHHNVYNLFSQSKIYTWEDVFNE